MNRSGAILFLALMLALAVMYAWFRLSTGNRGSDGSAMTSQEESPKHLVTMRMAETSKRKMSKRAPDFRVRGNDGNEYVLQELIRKGPVVLTFTKIGCPCSEAAQPFFNRLAAAYPRVRILGVIDGEPGPANLWNRKLHASYPALLDPDLRLVRDYGVENSAYVVLIDCFGRIAEHWPGYSATMLQQLGMSMARMTGTSFTPIEATDAPADLYTGCPYAL